MMEMIENELNSHKQTVEDCIESIQSYIYTGCILSIEVLSNGKKIILFGNGGSAADAQHIAAELTGRYKIERKGLPAIALTTDTSALTAIANDYGYEEIFSRQVQALANEGDLIIGISTSGNSQNVINGFRAGRERGCKTIGLTGKDGGKINTEVDLNIVIPSQNTPRIQEMHILIGHIIAQSIDDAY